MAVLVISQRPQHDDTCASAVLICNCIVISPEILCRCHAVRCLLCTICCRLAAAGIIVSTHHGPVLGPRICTLDHVGAGYFEKNTWFLSSGNSHRGYIEKT